MKNNDDLPTNRSTDLPAVTDRPTSQADQPSQTAAQVPQPADLPIPAQ